MQLSLPNSTQSIACPLLEKLPPEIRFQIWQNVVQGPIRFGHSWSSCGSLAVTNRDSSKKPSPSAYHRAILTTNRQVFGEISPLLYERVCVVVAHPNQTLRWLQTISPRNSARIRHLVIKYHSLLLDYNEKTHIDDRMSAWSAALRCMPALLTLTFDFNELSTRRATPDDDIFANDTVILNELAKSALAWSKIHGPSNKPSTSSFQYRPQRAPPEPSHGRQQQFNHVVIGIDEDVPSPWQRFFAKHLHTTYNSLDLPVTGLPSKFFAQEDYELTSTYAFNGDKSKQVSVVLASQKLPRLPIKPDMDDLNFVLAGLPTKYLRLGCRHMNSQSLYPIPNLANELVTLDLAFTDPDPKRVATYLDYVQLRCPALYTVAIAVSPLHDRDPNDPKPERFFNRESVSIEVATRWKPFWDKMDKMNASGVKIREGKARYRLLNGLNSGLAFFEGLHADHEKSQMSFH